MNKKINTVEKYSTEYGTSNAHKDRIKKSSDVVQFVCGEESEVEQVFAHTTFKLLEFFRVYTYPVTLKFLAVYFKLGKDEIYNSLEILLEHKIIFRGRIDTYYNFFGGRSRNVYLHTLDSGYFSKYKRISKKEKINNLLNLIHSNIERKFTIPELKACYFLVYGHPVDYSLIDLIRSNVGKYNVTKSPRLQSKSPINFNKNLHIDSYILKNNLGYFYSILTDTMYKIPKNLGLNRNSVPYKILNLNLIQEVMPQKIGEYLKAKYNIEFPKSTVKSALRNLVDLGYFSKSNSGYFLTKSPTQIKVYKGSRSS